MTAQGEDILAWLDTAITIHENAAKRACEGGAGRWYSGGSPDDRHVDEWELESDVIYSEDDVTQAKALVYNEVHPSKDRSVHIALHDPESVLRRCAADRKLIYEVRRTAYNAKSYPWDPMYGPYADAMLHAAKVVAEGYGWTEKTSAPDEAQTPPTDGDQVT